MPFGPPQASCAAGPGGPVRIVQVAVGGEHTCTLDERGSVCCWGANDVGQLGDGTIRARREPVQVPGLTAAARIAAGGRSTCAALVDGSVRCWGDNFRGQLGDGTTTTRLAPTSVQGLSGVRGLSVGPTRACAVLDSSSTKDGPLRCWGDVKDDNPQIGSTVPVPIPTEGEIIDLVSGGVTRILLESGTVLRVDRVIHPPSMTVAEIDYLRGDDQNAARVTRLATSCAVGKDGALRGCTVFGQWEPIQMRGVARVATCSDRGCAVMIDGSVRCWGLNERRELGFESPPDCEHSAKAGSSYHRCAQQPALVPSVAGALEVAVGDHHACALLRDGTVTCWGILPPERGIASP